MTKGGNAFAPYSLYLNGKIVTEITIPESIEKLPAYVFQNCISLKKVTVPNSVKSFSADVFNGCNSIESIKLPFIPYYGFCRWFGSGSATDVPQTLKTVTVNGKSLPDNAFNGCANIENIILSDSITEIKTNALKGCASLKSLTLPFVGERADGSGATYFGYLFGADEYNYQASSIPKTLKSLKINGGTIAENAFYNCSSLENMEVCESVKSIGQYAFNNCNFKNLTIANGVKNVDKRALVFVSCENLTVHADVITAVYGISPSVLSYDLKTLTITGGNAKAYHSTDGDPLCGFDDCPNLTKVVFKSGVTQIGDRILDMTNCPNNSLSEIVIEEGATSIGEYAFMHCDKLTDIVLPDSVTNIGHAAFADCSSLTTVTIGKNMKNIDDFAFTGCNAITDINYNGTKSQWNAIKKDSWISYSAKYTVHCTDGDIAKK